MPVPPPVTTERMATTLTFNEDLPQIEEAAECTTYEVMRICDEKGKMITRTGAIRLLGREVWLDGLVRSAFHWTACRYLDDKRVVCFDSHELFKWKGVLEAV